MGLGRRTCQRHLVGLKPEASVATRGPHGIVVKEILFSCLASFTVFSLKFSKISDLEPLPQPTKPSPYPGGLAAPACPPLCHVTGIEPIDDV